MLTQLAKLHLNILNRGRRMKDRAVLPLINSLPGWVKPAHFTSLRVIILAIALLLYLQDLIGNAAFLFLIIISALTDALDGALARAKQSITGFGATYDLLADRLMFMAVFFFFYEITDNYGWIGQILIDLVTAVILLILWLLKKNSPVRPLMTLRWLIFFLWLLSYLVFLVLK